MNEKKSSDSGGGGEHMFIRESKEKTGQDEDSIKMSITKSIERRKENSISFSDDPTNSKFTEIPKKLEPYSKMSEVKLGVVSGLRLGSVLKAWPDISKINFFSSRPSVYVQKISESKKSSTGIACTITIQPGKQSEEIFSEQFPSKMTQLLNEGQYWGCFYCFPELYGDAYSPTVRIRHIEDVPEMLGGVLTRDVVTTCLSYPKRTPILGDFVYIKLNLTNKFLKNIDVLQHYKYLVYLDLSSNFLTEIKVLEHLLYLQYLSVDFNRLSTVLEYDTPQWFLTEVHYKYNSVKKIADLSMFWSITVLDLSHNNITAITGLETLNYLRRLDLSFNHIQRLENLNHLRLLWLDVSYNNISSFELGADCGLWTLMYLEHLDLNENNLTSIKMFSGCTRLRELHVRNNRLGMLLELAVFMRQMRRLTVLDMRGNPICSVSGYNIVVINTFPLLMSLDSVLLDPVYQRTIKMDMSPNVNTFATRRLLRLLYIEQLSRSRVAPSVPAADTTEVPLVILVGYDCSGKGTLARRLALECSNYLELAVSHTTAQHHFANHYKVVTRAKFDEMLLAGELLTYSEIDGESYGLSRDEAAITPGKVRIACMDLVGALMLKSRGRRPYLILATCKDRLEWAKRQKLRKTLHNIENQKRKAQREEPVEKETLQVLLSGRILVTGIINEIILYLEDDKDLSEFVVDSECSLMMNSDDRAQTIGDRVFDMLYLSSSSTNETEINTEQNSNLETSLFSLYKCSATGEYNSYLNEKISNRDKGSTAKKSETACPRPKSVDFSRYASSTWKGVSSHNLPESCKSKSVTFNSTDADPTGLLIEPITETQAGDKAKDMRSVSARIRNTPSSYDDMDLWLAFLAEAGERKSEAICPSRLTPVLSDDPNQILHEMNAYKRRSIPFDINSSTKITDDYEELNRQLPGTFRDTVMMDDPDAAYEKVKKIIKNIVKDHKSLKPMFDISFDNLVNYPTVEKRLKSICKQISPKRMFY